MSSIIVTSVSESTCVPADQYPGAVDATVTVDGLDGEVTLVVNQHGRLDSWKSIDHWLSQSLHGCDRETQYEIVAAVREAARED